MLRLMKIDKHDCRRTGFVSTHWDQVDANTGQRREQELRERFWKSMIDRGSLVLRHYNTRESALDVVRNILPYYSQNA